MSWNWMAFAAGIPLGVALTLSIYNRKRLNAHFRMITRLQADVIDLKYNPKKKL